MPEASEPPMWWSNSGWELNTETGWPSAAQTLLKFTPAAITRTITSKAPGSGTSICSSWKASLGSPSRSWRITQAAIVSGSSPGSTLRSATALVSVAMVRSLLRLAGGDELPALDHSLLDLDQPLPPQLGRHLPPGEDRHPTAFAARLALGRAADQEE